jgi:hypothetical protein
MSQYYSDQHRCDIDLQWIEPDSRGERPANNPLRHDKEFGIWDLC